MRINVRVVPNAKKPKITREGDSFKIWIDAPARDGKANKRLVEIIAAETGAKKSEIHIVQGEKSRNKVIEVPDQVATRLFGQTA
ncbi:MAG: DUF167 domain-containing protein [Candidatus Diapherotrites archaeon]|nr:DUF167 domain-containing protein [Candidatus Diapherotrites archaeon]